MAAPKPGEPVLFDEHVKPLFREKDRDSMSFAFDLGSYDEVSDNADLILRRLRSGTMPCDGPWPAERVNLFERWVQNGKQP